ncbi:hypothetical protein THAOC_32578 [Thalassiosira oceanica]|uniref:Uncharacterized protein n=1 Tax=Thalassiosira oceanica TaxID=159749 RepID=K0R8Y2_THAOC|nr:hypothetical protein THAOC_32578 [Thalassiosira oceanica]|eukprot:EJK48609.1 hypothetical protein THAOC_32578 [Thalassiosira oceanica]
MDSDTYQSRHLYCSVLLSRVYKLHMDSDISKQTHLFYYVEQCILYSRQAARSDPISHSPNWYHPTFSPDIRNLQLSRPRHALLTD